MISRAQIVQPLVDSGELAPPYQIQLSGSADDLRRTRQALQWNFLLALVITYLLMAALFESFLYPFVIMLSVPPALAGGILGLEVVNLTLTYQPLDILTMLGFVILIGVVVNNAILIVHQTLNILREAPETPIKEAIRDAVFSRVRPIFMSMITSALGMLPLVVFPGAGSELYRGSGQRRDWGAAAVHPIHPLPGAHVPQPGHGSKGLDQPRREGDVRAVCGGCLRIVALTGGPLTTVSAN